MADDDDKPKNSETLIGIRKISDGKKLTEREKLAVENHTRFMIKLRKFLERMEVLKNNIIKYWLLYLLSAIGGGTGVMEFINNINVVN